MSQRETSLARVVAGLLPVSDAWGEFAEHYLRALDPTRPGGRVGRAHSSTSRRRAEALSEWHALLVDRLLDSDYEDRIDRLIDHPALAGRARTDLQARRRSAS